uniref:Uncharacterized protein n=1 Tax=Oncorhynchus mykiss TaxID=8022 RepID=A0A8K9UTH3_ONCMY
MALTLRNGYLEMLRACWRLQAHMKIIVLNQMARHQSSQIMKLPSSYVPQTSFPNSNNTQNIKHTDLLKSNLVTTFSINVVFNEDQVLICHFPLRGNVHMRFWKRHRYQKKKIIVQPQTVLRINTIEVAPRLT